MPSKTIVDFANQIKDYMRSAEVVEGKQLIPYPYLTNETDHRGIHFASNSDGTINFSGVPTYVALAFYRIYRGSFKAGTYVLSDGGQTEYGGMDIFFYDDPACTIKYSGTSTGLISDGYSVYTTTTKNGTTNVSANNKWGYAKEFTIDRDCYALISARAGNSAYYSTNQSGVIYPMICSLADWNVSHTYEPYYVPVKDSKFDIADQQVLGAWNLLKYPYYDTTKSVSGLDYTDLGDGSVEADGTSTVSNNDFTCFSRGIMNYELEAGTYYVSGCPEGGSESTYHLRISKNKVYNNPSQGFDDLGIDTGDGFSFTLTEKSQLNVVIRIGQTSINHLIFKPMISLEPNQPYVPYAMTNRELTEVVEHTLTPNSKLNVSDVKCISCGRIHSLTFLATATQSIGQDESLFTGTIPYGSTPYYFFKTTYGDKMCEIQNGKIVIKSSAAANDVIRGSVTWIY